MKRFLLYISLQFLLFSTQAQLLWKVSGNGLKHPSYLFGTHNLIPIQFLDSVPGLYKAFNSSDIIISEMLTNNVDATAKIQQAAIMPNHIKINDLLSQEEQIIVDNSLKSMLKIGLKEINMMNPSMVMTLYKMEMFKNKTGFSDDVQIDSYFQLVATEKNKKVIGLETVEQQIDLLFGNTNFQKQANLLLESIKKSDAQLTDMMTDIKLYKEGQIDELIKVSQANKLKEDISLTEYAKIIDNRNSDWITKLPMHFQASKCFVTVGALHLGGPNGLIKLLQKKGYKVIPCTNNK